MVNVTEEKFVKTVEEDIERIGRFVTLQSESLHLRLLRLLQLSSDVSEVYTLDYLRGAEIERASERASARRAIHKGWLTWCRSLSVWVTADTHLRIV